MEFGSEYVFVGEGEGEGETEEVEVKWDLSSFTSTATQDDSHKGSSATAQGDQEAQVIWSEKDICEK